MLLGAEGDFPAGRDLKTHVPSFLCLCRPRGLRFVSLQTVEELSVEE